MTQKLNIAWITSRKESCFEWFIKSLVRQLKGDYTGIRVIVVDFWSQLIPHYGWHINFVRERIGLMRSICPLGLDVVITPPKPTPWQGPHRLTKKDYFAAANARNTAICLAHDGCLAYVDDLSVLLPTWLPAVLESCAAQRITCGAFKKLKKLMVKDGEVISFEEFPPGMDSRWHQVKEDLSEAHRSWTFGCSQVAPLERYLELNGWPEMGDSTGVCGEDTAMGVAWGNRGHKIWYDRRMLTYESEELHHNQMTMGRDNKKIPGPKVRFVPEMETPNDKDFMMVAMLHKARRFKNYFEEGGIRKLRERVLGGEPFPVILEPRHCYFTKTPIEEL